MSRSRRSGIYVALDRNKAAKKLAEQFINNFRQFADNVETKALIPSGPQI